MRDWLGQEILVGSKVVYPGGASSHIFLTHSDVVELDPLTVIPRERTGYRGASPVSRQKPVKIQRPDRVTVVG